MLEAFRNQSKSWAIWAILSIIILAFIFTFNTSGGPISGRPGAETVGTMVEVYGETIHTADLDLALQLSADPPPPGASGVDKLQAANRYERSRMLFSGVADELIGLTPFADGVPPTKRAKVMTELIASVLVSRDAAARGLGVSDAELTARVMRIARIFGQNWNGEDGRFDPRKYDIFVRYQLGTTKGQFESFMRREILRDKMAHVVTAGVTVNDKELAAIEVAENDRPRVEFVAIDAESAKAAVKVTDEEATAFATKNADKVKAAYEAAGDKYNKPAAWGVRGILLKAPQEEELAGKDEAAKKEAQGKWDAQRTAADSLKKEIDDVLAGKTAIDPPPASSGGDDKDAKPAGEAKKLNDVPEADRKLWLDKWFEKLAGDKTEHDLTKDIGGKFPDDKDESALGRAPFGEAVAKAVAAANVGDVVGPLKGSHGWWIIRVESKVEAVSTPLESVQLELAKGLAAEERAEEELDKIAASVLAKAKAGKDTKLVDVVKAWNQDTTGSDDSPLSASTSGAIGKAPTRAMTGSLEALLGLPPREEKAGDIPGMGNLPEVEKAAWKLTAAAPLADKVFKSTDGKIRYVIRLAAKEAEPADDEGKKAKKQARDNLRDTVESMRRVAVWQEYVGRLRADAEAAGEVEQTTAWKQILDADRKRYAENLAKIKAAAPAAPAAGGSPFKVQVSPPKFSEPQPEPGAPAAPAGDKPAEAPAAPAEAPAAPAAAPAEAPAEPAKK